MMYYSKKAIVVTIEGLFQCVLNQELVCTDMLLGVG